MGHSAEMKAAYNNRLLQFSCAANWIHYAITKSNQTIGDYLEGVMGHVVYTDNLKDIITDLNGKPLNNNLLITPYGSKIYCYLRYIPTILMPTICFYGIDMEDYLRQNKSWTLSFNEICRRLEYKPECSSVLVIKNMELFEKDLKQAIVVAVGRSTKLTNDGFANSFIKEEPYCAKFIDYNKYDYSKLFLDHSCNIAPLFTKDKKYADQREYRIVINNLRFTQRFGCENYNHKQNTLLIRLKHLHYYADLLSAKDNFGLLSRKYDLEHFFFQKIKR